MLPKISLKLARLRVRAFSEEIIKFRGDDIESNNEIVSVLDNMGSYNYVLDKLDLDLKNRITLPTRLSIKEPLVLKLKDLPFNFYCVILGSINTLLFIIIADFVDWKVEALVSLLNRFKMVIGWSTTNITKHVICTYKILLELNFIPSAKHQQRLNLLM